MTQVGFLELVLILVFVPLLYFMFSRVFVGGATVDEATLKLAAEEAEWKEPDSYVVDLEHWLACKVVEETLPNFFYDKEAWEIDSVEKGNPTSISSSIVCIEETDPGCTERYDIALVTTIVDHRPSDNCTLIRLKFIVYEGSGPHLERICRQTFDFVRKALQAQSTVSQPQAVPAAQEVQEDLPSSGQPSEKAADFFMQSATREQEGKSELSTDDDTGPSPGHEFAPRKKSEFQSRQVEQVPDFVTPQMVPEAVQPEPTPTPSIEISAVPLFVPPAIDLPAAPIFVPPAFDLPAPPPVPSASNTLNPSSSADLPGTAGGAALCPGCSQPINPSFPFCLYCGKNF